MEALDLHVYLLNVLRTQRHELIDDDQRGQSIVCRRAVNLLALPLDLANFFVNRLRPIPESFSAIRSLPVELHVVSPRGGTILSFTLERSQVILPA
jgi:hypothetical protein